MEVNPSWGFRAELDGTAFHFCAKQCRQTFLAAPDRFLGERCMVCQERLQPRRSLAVTYLGETYRVCSPAHRAAFKADPAAYFMHRMWGIPAWMYYLSIALVMLVSFLAFEAPSGDAPGGRRHPTRDLMAVRAFRAAARSRVFRFVTQLVMAGAFAIILAAGFFGNQNPARNIAPLTTWTIWWCGLVVLIMYAGKSWCYVCPWDAMAGWAEKLRLWRKTEEGLGLGLPWPRSLRNVGLATGLFVGLTWVEIGYGVTMKPWATAALGLAMLLLAVGCAFVFDRKSFCRYACLVGRVSGLYAMFSSVEVRSRDAQVCRTCSGKECVTGTKDAYGCPTFQYPGGMVTNTYCIQCAECLQSCSKDNMAVNLRPWGTDLAVEGRPRSDEAYLALLMLAISGFHGLTMTPVWGELTAALGRVIPGGHLAAFSAGMAALMLLPVAVYAALVGWSLRIARRSAPEATKGVSYHAYFVRYAYCVLPIALFYHLAHNLEHLLMEGPKVIVLASDPFGWGWDLLGTASWSVPPMISLDVLWVLQVLLVGVGHVYSLWAASRISRRLFRDAAASRRSQWPLLAGMILFSVFSLWLLKQPMEMRTSVM